MTPVIIHFINLGLALAAAFAALYVYSRVLNEYRPMLIFIWLVAGLELLRTLDESSGIVNTVDDVHYLAEVLLVAWIMKRWQVFQNRSRLFYILILFILGCFAFEKLVTGPVNGWSWCRILFSLLIALMGIELMSRTLLSAPESLSRHTVYIFSRALIFYYLLLAIAEAVLLILKDPPTSEVILVYFYFGMALSSLTFLLYLKSVVCTPKKDLYSMH
jgi:hypothetical protein